MSDVENRITEYFAHGGLYNPELMEHWKVRDLIVDCRDEIARLRLTDAEREAVEFFVGFHNDGYGMIEARAATLRNLLKRTK